MEQSDLYESNFSSARQEEYHAFNNYSTNKWCKKQHNYQTWVETLLLKRVQSLSVCMFKETVVFSATTETIYDICQSQKMHFSVHDAT